MSESRYKQEKRVASVKIDGQKEDDLLLNRMNGVDKVGQPFKYTVEMLRNIDAKIDISKLVGKKLTISLKPTLKGPPVRYFNGYIADIRYGGASTYGLACYYALAVPWLWFLNTSSNCRIFRDKTVKDILTVVFKSAKPSFEDFETKDLSTHPKLEHCVQYHETDYAFVHRLMEEYGISYYFEHKDNEHKMILLDSSGKRPKPPECGFKEIKYIRSNVSDEANTIRHWERRKQVVTDAFEQTDFNFASKDMFPAILSAKAEGTLEQGDFAAKSFENRVYEAAFEEGVSDPHELVVSKLTETAEKVAKVRLGSFQAEQDIVYAQSECRGLHAGYEFKLTDYDADSAQNNKEYYVTSVNHQIDVGGYGARKKQTGKRYTCSITAIPKETEYYPLQLTPKARIYGPQTATVVSEGSKDKKLIYTDKHGRVKICFHWDRVDDRKSVDKVAEGGKDEVDKNTKNLSCWVRVAQGWAGNKWGSFFLPRVGQEVIVEFLDGDPDRPIVTGSVYNGKNLPPYKLPEHKTLSTIKSESVGADGKKAKKISFNELRFEDEEDSEQIFIHAAKAMDTQVLGDHREYVGCNMQLTIDGNKDNKEKSKDKAIGNRDVLIKEGNDQLTLKKGNLIQKVGGGSLLEVTEHKSISIGGTLNIKVTGEIFIASDKAIHIKSAESIIAEAKESISFKAGKDIILKADGAINFDAGKKILGKGASGVGFKGDSSTIDISGDVGIKGGSNVVIKGSKVDINGGAPASPDAPSAPETVTEPTIQTADDLKKAKVAEALKEKERLKEDGTKGEDKIEFSDLK